MKKMLPLLLLILLASCQMHSLGLDVATTSMEDLLTAQGLDEEEVKERMKWPEKSLLRVAARQGWVSVVHKLLLQGVPLDSKNSYNGYTPLHLAVLYGHTEIAKALLEKGAPMDSTDYAGTTPLHRAAERGHTEVVRLLLEKGATVDSKNKYGYTPLLWAAIGGHTEVAALLLSHGADLTSTNIYGQTALQRAQSNNKTETAAFLELAEGKSKEWLEGYAKGFSGEKKREKDKKKVHAFAEAYADIYEEEKDHDFADTYTPLYLQHIKTGNTPKNAKNMARAYVLEVMY